MLTLKKFSKKTQDLNTNQEFYEKHTKLQILRQKS